MTFAQTAREAVPTPALVVLALLVLGGNLWVLYPILEQSTLLTGAGLIFFNLSAVALLLVCEDETMPLIQAPSIATLANTLLIGLFGYFVVSTEGQKRVDEIYSVWVFFCLVTLFVLGVAILFQVFRSESATSMADDGEERTSFV
ncbi:hypothetical protein JCM8097_003300 [Rhodosporidiobolus ruineniae]